MGKGIRGALTLLALLCGAPAGAEARPAGVPRIEGLALSGGAGAPDPGGVAAPCGAGAARGGGAGERQRALCAGAGWREAEDCAGTGMAPCRFRFRGPRGRVIHVVTLGEAPHLVVDNVSDAPR